jgi:tRNA (guanine37-N1)-methyltransferase
MRIDILSLFPQMLVSALETSILGRAARSGLVSYHLHDIRSWTTDKYGKVDDKPFGGEPGMVMMAQPLFDSVMSVEEEDPRQATRILLSPQGERLVQERIEALSRLPRLLLVAGHYEGVDERAIEELALQELSVGDFVVSGGEIPALLLVDAVVRLLPGALGDEASAGQDSFSRPCDQGRRLLEGPHYTRPREWRGRRVPDVLVSGDHEAVRSWRMAIMLSRTAERRPDLLEQPRTPGAGPAP